MNKITINLSGYVTFASLPPASQSKTKQIMRRSMFSIFVEKRSNYSAPTENWWKIKEPCVGRQCLSFNGHETSVKLKMGPLFVSSNLNHPLDLNHNHFCLLWALSKLKFYKSIKKARQQKFVLLFTCQITEIDKVFFRRRFGTFFSLFFTAFLCVWRSIKKTTCLTMKIFFQQKQKNGFSFSKLDIIVIHAPNNLWLFSIEWSLLVSSLFHVTLKK